AGAGRRLSHAHLTLQLAAAQLHAHGADDWRRSGDRLLRSGRRSRGRLSGRQRDRAAGSDRSRARGPGGVHPGPGWSRAGTGIEDGTMTMTRAMTGRTLAFGAMFVALA